MPVEDLIDTLEASGETEARVAKALGISDRELAGWSRKLFGQTFSAERDELAGKDANAQVRGQISRRLKAKIRAEIDRVGQLMDDSDRIEREQAADGNG